MLPGAKKGQYFVYLETREKALIYTHLWTRIIGL